MAYLCDNEIDFNDDQSGENGDYNAYKYTREEMQRYANKIAGRYTNRLIWEWLAEADYNGGCVVDMTECGTIIERACHVQALQEIKQHGSFNVVRKSKTKFEIV